MKRGKWKRPQAKLGPIVAYKAWLNEFRELVLGLDPIPVESLHDPKKRRKAVVADEQKDQG